MTPVLKTLAVRASSKGLEITCEISPEVPEDIIADPGRLRQIVINLMGNAIKFTERGEVGLRISVESKTAEMVMLHFTVHDTGIGIHDDKKALVFEAFSQADASTARKAGGTGLGLTISKRLVEMMGGKIWFESVFGQGSSFHFTAEFAISQATTGPQSSLQFALKGLPVMVVDDHPTSRQVLAAILTKRGLRPTLMESGESALLCLRRHTEPFAFILVDCHMPGMDGFAFAQELQRSPSIARDARIIMLTAAGFRGDAARCRQLGVGDYLTKPIIESDLLEIMARVIGMPKSQANAPLLTRHSLHESPRKLNILLAEDNRVNQKVAIRLLEKQGHEVTVADNGLLALAAFAHRKFDLILMDVQMPEMDGFEATAAIREQESTSGTHVRIVAMTANAMQGDRERCLDAGMDDYIAKPIRAQDLVTLLANLKDEVTVGG